MTFKGGESEGLKRLEAYCKKAVNHYSKTRQSLIGPDYSAKLSPWLSNGCLSIRKIFQTVSALKQNESTKVFIDNLLVRDFYRYWCMRNQDKMFTAYGIYDRKYYNWQTNDETVQRWKAGLTGMPFIDALIREMNQTGYMPQ